MASARTVKLILSFRFYRKYIYIFEDRVDVDGLSSSNLLWDCPGSVFRRLWRFIMVERTILNITTEGRTGLIVECVAKA